MKGGCCGEHNLDKDLVMYRFLLAAIAALSFFSTQAADACERCSARLYVVEVYEETCDEEFASCVEWAPCGKIFYETRRLECGSRVRTAKWSLVEGTVKRKPTSISGVAWITEDPSFCGKKALRTSSTSCSCGCYTVWIRTCVYSH